MTLGHLHVCEIMCLLFFIIIPFQAAPGRHQNKLGIKKKSVHKALKAIYRQKLSQEQSLSLLANLIQGNNKRAQKARLFIEKHNRLFHQGIKRLYHIEGFFDLMHTILASSGFDNVSGHIYELKKALEIVHADNGEYIEFLCLRIVADDQEYECDIVTNLRLIECKRGSQNTESWRAKTTQQLKRLKTLSQSDPRLKQRPLHLSVQFPHPPETMAWVAQLGAEYSHGGY